MGSITEFHDDEICHQQLSQADQVTDLHRPTMVMLQKPVAVGTGLTASPRTDPDVRIYRIRFLPWVLDVKAHIEVWMHDAR